MSNNFISRNKFLFCNFFPENRWNEVESLQIQPFVCYATDSIQPHSLFDAPRIMKVHRVLAFRLQHFSGEKRAKCREIYIFWAEFCFDVWRLESLTMGSKTLYLYMITHYTQCYQVCLQSQVWLLHQFIDKIDTLMMIISNCLNFICSSFPLCDLKNFGRNIYLVRLNFGFLIFYKSNQWVLMTSNFNAFKLWIWILAKCFSEHDTIYDKNTLITLVFLAIFVLQRCNNNRHLYYLYTQSNNIYMFTKMSN